MEVECVEIIRKIKIDKLQILGVLKDWIDKNGLDINSDVDFEQLDNDFCYFEIEANGYLYLDLSPDMAHIQLMEYKTTINSGRMVWWIIQSQIIETL